MITITLCETCPRINLTDEHTFEDIRIECRNYEEEKELLIQLVDKLLRTEREE